MTTPFVGEIRAWPCTFAPLGWAFCDGQLVSISQNTALFSLLGTYYGGNGTSNFALPNLQGAFPRGAGQGQGLSPVAIGDVGGQSTVTLTLQQLPAHTHLVNAVSGPGSQNSPANAVYAEAHFGRGVDQVYSTATPNSQMNPSTIGLAGGSQPHENMPPYLGLNFIIALQGVYPQRP